MEDFADMLTASQTKEHDDWLKRAERIEKIEDIIECTVFGITAVYGLFVLF